MKEAVKNLIESMDELMNRLMKETVNRDTLKNMSAFAKISNVLVKVCGVLLVLSGLYIFYKIFSSLL